jgi:deazaflavin-dependent oxidoreductase (nitroreductase family)
LASEGPSATDLPPRWIIRLAWMVHRAIYRFSGGRSGLRPVTADQWGMMRLHTVGRRSGAERLAIVAYFEDGPRLVTIAMNGWGDAEPAWWLNLQTHPDARVDLVSGVREVRARAATGAERTRLWERWQHYDKDLDRHSVLRSRETAVVVLDPSA